ncbi:MAG: flavin reductase family protein [Paracoccus sp. (in: a-proteobacteria)]|nr:flavin reductase family protein [Paracoccus sp. (in: a-proteobacteria)]
MFYRPDAGHGLRFNPFKAIVAPRPIGWISTRGADGDNLAPYSFFNAIADMPPQVMFASSGTKPDRDEGKDSLSHIAATGVFCVNIASAALREAMNRSSAGLPAGTSEFGHAGVSAAECQTISCPRVAGAPASLECRMTRIMRLPGDANWLVLGMVTGVHLRDDCIRDGRFDLSADGWIARLGYRDFAALHETFEMERPE